MARPRELYSGAAPQAMSMMGAGIADAYANAGRIEGQGMTAIIHNSRGDIRSFMTIEFDKHID